MSNWKRQNQNNPLLLTRVEPRARLILSKQSGPSISTPSNYTTPSAPNSKPSLFRRKYTSQSSFSDLLLRRFVSEY
ncbi:hypothetical protein L1987_25260 [Smallanthus sonchifolius]|uniref:Uncharacterized protein n=1 Tax=Smallanthus sonchifolius TaxID=185202 RepID=A0ACB9ILZ9_9ASTR|nr:hypothetical protein L1987_25260 [Smallanthus sonchifolius]